MNFQLLSLLECLLFLLLVSMTQAQYSIDNTDAIKRTASSVAYDLMKLYVGNQTGQTPGILPGPPSEHKGDYYWWQGGAMMGTYIDYWHYTGDTSYNDVVMQGVLHQAGEKRDYMPRNFTASLGNDDQGFWGMTVMLAAENKFPDPPADKPQWLALAQAVWATQADPSRHDNTCGGGMRWQIPFANNGYDYKNTIANGIFFNMGARLARYTGNNTYAEYAERTWDWLWSVKYIDHQSWRAYDGAKVHTNCTDIDLVTYSYNAAVLTQGAAFMFNYTGGSTKWRERTDKLLDSLLNLFFRDGVAFEPSCEEIIETPDGRRSTCSTDMISFKGYVHRWMAVVAQIAPHTASLILPLLKSSATAAVRQCTGGASRRQCGFQWHSGKFVDPAVVSVKQPTTGAGEYMDVLGAVSSLLVNTGGIRGPLTAKTGGTSRGSPDGGFAGGDNGQKDVRPITAADRAGAAILTALVGFCALATFVWIGFAD